MIINKSFNLQLPESPTVSHKADDVIVEGVEENHMVGGEQDEKEGERKRENG